MGVAVLFPYARALIATVTSANKDHEKFVVAAESSLDAFYIMESVYHLYNDLYPHFLKNVPVPVNGYVTAPELPGLGLEVREEPFRNGEAVIETIAEL